MDQRVYRLRRAGGAVVCFILAFALFAAPAPSKSRPQTLRIGTCGTLTEGTTGHEENALRTLKDFIKSETGFDNEIVRQKSWRELAQKMADKQLEIGVFQGYEFAWAQEKHAALEPLALAVNIYPYRTIYIVVRGNSPANNIADLQGKVISVPRVNQRYLELFLEGQTKSLGKEPAAFFARIATPENYEDALDDVVDGVVQAAVADRAGLEAYKRRKVARFKQIKELAHSVAFPPAVIAQYNDVLDRTTQEHFRQGLLNANKKEKGQQLLSAFRLTGFSAPPSDFGQKLTEFRKTYRAADAAGK